MKIGIIIQARMTSTRLPGKVMLDLCGKTVLGHLVERVKRSNYQLKIIIATTINKSDDIIADFAKKSKLGLFRGSEKDVLSRYYLGAKKYNLDSVIRITSDCPLYESDILDKMITEFLNFQDVDYFSNGLKKRTFPRGLDTEIFTFKALEKAYKEATEPSCKEHVTPYFYANQAIFKCESYMGEEDHSNLRWTLDTPEDYQLISKIYEVLYPKNPKFNYKNILDEYKLHPEWLKINNSIEQKKVGYKSI